MNIGQMTLAEECSCGGEPHDGDYFERSNCVYYSGANFNAKIVQHPEKQDEADCGRLNIQRVLDSRIFREADSENGNCSRLGDKGRRPTIEKPPKGSIGLAQKLIITPCSRIGSAKLSV